jgi:hypothetical protein
MHGYCGCKRCGAEWAARNAYHIEDDFETPYKSKRPYKAKPRGKGCPARKSENKKAHIYVWVEYRGQDWKYERKDNGDLTYRLRPSTWYHYECIGCGHINTKRWWWGTPPTPIYSIVPDAGVFRWK